MSEEEHLFHKSNSCWICEKLIDHDNGKVRDHCHVTGKFTGAAHWDCNINFRLTKKVLVLFQNLRGYDSHLINIKWVKNIHGIFLGKSFVFIDSMQFMNSSFDKLVKNLSDEDFKYFLEEFDSKNLELLKQKGVYPYEYTNSFEGFN